MSDLEELLRLIEINIKAGWRVVYLCLCCWFMLVHIYLTTASLVVYVGVHVIFYGMVLMLGMLCMCYADREYFRRLEQNPDAAGS